MVYGLLADAIENSIKNISTGALNTSLLLKKALFLRGRYVNIPLGE